MGLIMKDVLERTNTFSEYAVSLQKYFTLNYKQQL